MKNIKAKLIFGLIIGTAVITQIVTVCQASWYRFR